MNHIYIFFLIFLFIYLFIYGCVGSSFLCEGPLQLRQAGATLHRGAQASLVAEHRLQTRRLSNCGSRAQSLRGMWDPPRPGPEPASPALAGRLSTTAPPGKPWTIYFFKNLTKQKQTQRYREQNSDSQRGRHWADEWNRWGRLKGTNY